MDSSWLGVIEITMFAQRSVRAAGMGLLQNHEVQTHAFQKALDESEKVVHIMADVRRESWRYPLSKTGPIRDRFQCQRVKVIDR